ncbi:DUF1501 domain-containing protein [Neorhodopirellula lusitana]|uniref:DUF1501 domain-containing protein n=1 Tax=Neorhodopirellula lusitana TaxID=445327 RepID=UPI00384C305F
MTSRRAAIQAGVCGGLGLSLGDMFRLQSQGGEAFSMTQGQTLKDPKALSVIQLHLGGGFPQHESFDPKPESPVEYRGAFGIQKTNTGEIFSDNFPNTAAVADKLTIIRSMVGKIPDHAVATYHLFTGYTPTAVIDFPQMGSIISHELGKRGDLPPYVAIPNNHSFAGGTGFLSSTHGPFELNADPAERNYKVKDFSIPERVSMERFDRRKTAREIIEQKIRGLEADPTMLDTMDDFYQQAYTLLTSKESQAAFALDGETEETFELYGRDVVGLKGPDNKFHPKGLAEKMIVARRLVESGVRFVTVNYGAWDSHVDVEKDCLDQMPALDHAIAGLITDLDRRGLLDTTIFWVTSEFGRTPKINNTSGRDHWARNYSMLVAGGGFAPGLVYGASDSIGGEPARDAVPLENLMHTIYHQLGIDAGKELLAFGTRPIEIIKDGKLVKGLLS